MSKSGGTWKKGEKPPVQKPKGVKHKKTVLRQALGISNWAELQGWVEGPGIQAAIAELSKLKGKAFVDAYSKLTEYVKPKLQRTEVLNSGSMELHFHEEKTYEADKKTDTGT